MESIKRLLFFVFKTILAGLILLLPLVVVTIILVKVLSYLIGFIMIALQQLNSALGIHDSPEWIGITLIVLVFFIIGLLLKVKRLKSVINIWEDKVLALFPGYRFVKSIAHEHGFSDDRLMKPALYKVDDTWQPCFLVESKGNFCNIYIPEAPNVNAGNIIIVPSDKVILLPVTNFRMTLMVRDYGLGTIDLINREVEK